MFYRIKYYLPEYAPKSRNAYYRLKSDHPQEFAALMEIAEKSGIPLPTKPIYREPVDPEPDYKGGRKKPLLLFR